MIAIWSALVLQIVLFIHAWRKSGRVIRAIELALEQEQNNRRRAEREQNDESLEQTTLR